MVLPIFANNTNKVAHPGRVTKKIADNIETRRSVIQVAELEYKNGIISVDRDKPVYVKLVKQAINKRK